MDAREVARHLVRMGYSTESPDESVLLCPLRLQKLLYYCQGWTLALLGEPLFRQPIEAWKLGPVVKEVHQQFAGKRHGITPEEAGEPSEAISETVTDLIEMIWREYAKFTPAELVKMTHDEPAWKEARIGVDPDESSSNVLSAETMKVYFTEVARKAVPKSKYPMPDPVEVWQADLQYERHPESATPMDEVFRKLKVSRSTQPVG